MRLPKRKYGNKFQEVDGIRFHSKHEAGEYLKLKALEKGGLIRDLVLQKPFKLQVNGVLICTYIADFVYYDVKAQQTVVADAKGYRTREYVIKKRLMQAIYGINIFEL